MDSQESISATDEVTRHVATERDASRHTLTIKQAADLFSSLGVPRSPRSVQRFCEQGHLDAVRTKTDKTERYFIDPVSVERYAQELQQLENLSQLGADVSRHDAPQRVMTRSDATPITPLDISNPAPKSDREIVKLHERVDILEKENLQLKIDRSAKEQVIGHMIDERRDVIEQLTNQSREIGRLEMQVRQLEAPKEEVSRHDATQHDMTRSDVTEIVDEPTTTVEEGRGVAIVEPPAPTSESKQRPWWRW